MTRIKQPRRDNDVKLEVEEVEAQTESTLGQKVYATPNIRQRILRHSDTSDLINYTRIDKATLKDVVQILYHTVSYERALLIKSIDKARQITYLDAITIVDARQLSLEPETLKKLGLLPITSAAKKKQTVKVYSIEILDHVVPVLRKKCRNLRRVEFGGKEEAFGEESWTVILDQSQQPGKIGHIEHHRYVQFPSSRQPPPKISIPAPTPISYTASRRFDVEVAGLPPRYGGHQNQHQYQKGEEKWLAAIEDGPLFGALYRNIDFGPLQITLEDLVHLYDRQLSAGFSDKLQMIIVPRLKPFSIDSFRRFAMTAGSSLTSLQLLNDRDDHESNDMLPDLSFSDLPEIVSIIQTYLPNLTELDIGLNGIKTAESDCLRAVTADTLFRGGNIEKLRVFTISPDYRDDLTPFNIVRLVSQVCTAKATIYVGSVGVAGRAGSNPGVSETNYLRYLKGQNSARRSYLSTFDFRSVNISRLNDVHKLEYDEEGQIRLPSEKFE